jgi:hypothetical protein
MLADIVGHLLSLSSKKLDVFLSNVTCTNNNIPTPQWQLPDQRAKQVEMFMVGLRSIEMYNTLRQEK